ncbi:MAG: hypothetical protein H6634_09930 [Anaerolineales bacterium]|nr:hypothetical protein [Anaerolineales bacterium]
MTANQFFGSQMLVAIGVSIPLTVILHKILDKIFNWAFDSTDVQRIYFIIIAIASLTSSVSWFIGFLLRQYISIVVLVGVQVLIIIISVVAEAWRVIYYYSFPNYYPSGKKIFLGTLLNCLVISIVPVVFLVVNLSLPTYSNGLIFDVGFEYKNPFLYQVLIGFVGNLFAYIAGKILDWLVFK